MPIYGSYKLGQQGWGLTPLQIAGVIGIGTATMLVGSVPIGILADRYSKNERVLKGIQALGFAGFAVSYIIAGPAQLPGCAVFDTLHWFMFATALKGLSAATLNVCFNDLFLHLSEGNEIARAKVSGSLCLCITVPDMSTW